MTLTSKDKVIFSSIIKEFDLSNSIVEKSEKLIENLTNSRIDICKLFKIQNFKIESLEMNKKDLIESININRSKIKNNEKNKIQLRDKIKVNKVNIKMLRFHIKGLEDDLQEEKKQARILYEALEIFISREKFKFIKRLFVKKYKKAYFNYSDELSIKIKIKQCNERKDKIRKKEQDFNNSIVKYNRKISIYKSTLSEIRKSTLSMIKCNDLSTIKVKRVIDYKDLENKFRIAIKCIQN